MVDVVPRSVYRAACRGYSVKTLGRFRTCRRCGERTWDFDTETGEWWCDVCDAEADL